MISSRHRLSFFTLFAACMLAGCYDNVEIQSHYNDERDECRSSAEERFSEEVQNSASEIDDKTRNTELASLFSKCMSSRGWTVATPNRPRGEQAGDNRPFPGQTNPPPVNASRAPVPLPVPVPAPLPIPVPAAPVPAAPVYVPPAPSGQAVPLNQPAPYRGPVPLYTPAPLNAPSVAPETLPQKAAEAPKVDAPAATLEAEPSASPSVSVSPPRRRNNNPPRHTEAAPEVDPQGLLDRELITP